MFSHILTLHSPVNPPPQGRFAVPMYQYVEHISDENTCNMSGEVLAIIRPNSQATTRWSTRTTHLIWVLRYTTPVV